MEWEMKKLLFGTTALVGAFAFAGAANAQSVNVGGALDLNISGSSDFGIEYADEDLGFGDPDVDGGDREWFFNQDNEVVFNATGVGDATGISYGVQIELEMATGSGTEGGTNARFDEAYTFISGNFGEFRLGDEDAATDQLLITSSFVAAGTGGVDGNQRALGNHQIADSGEFTKILYFTPQIAGFQAGASYALKAGDRGENPFIGQSTSDHIDLAANWQGSFAGTDVGAYGGVTFFTIDAEDENAINYQLGGYAELFGFGFAGSIGFEDEDLEELGGRDLFWNVGVGGGFAGVDLSFNFQQDEFESGDLDNQEQYIFGASVPLLPGMALDGEVAYVSDFEGDGDQDGINVLLELGTAF
jgi:hypothetical protein